MDTGRPDLLAKLRVALAKGPRLRLAVVFGSHATGTATAESDVDVGILPEGSIRLGEELSLASSLSEATGTEVDLVRMDEASPVLGREIALSGVCLFEAGAGGFSAWRAEAMAHFIDIDEMIAPHRERFLQRLARRVRSGAGG